MSVSKPFDDKAIPDLNVIPSEYHEDVVEMFDMWGRVASRNAELDMFARMHDKFESLGYLRDIPDELSGICEVVGWPRKAIDVRAERSNFEGYVFDGGTNATMDAIVRENRMVSECGLATADALQFGPAFWTVMKGGRSGAIVRHFDAMQATALWDFDQNRIKCGIVCNQIDRYGNALKYTLHFPELVVVVQRKTARAPWASSLIKNSLGRPMMEPMVYRRDTRYPFGHSCITPEVISITQKAKRDVFNMDLAAAIYAFPQVWLLGVEPGTFAGETVRVDTDSAMEQEASSWGGSDTSEPSVTSPGDDYVEIRPGQFVKRKTRFETYMSRVVSIGRDANGDLPQLHQLSAADVGNLTLMFENDAQRFSGSTNVPLGQLGVLSHNYTSSDALGAANNPLILDVQLMNTRNKETMETVAQMALAVAMETSINELPDDLWNVRANFTDPASLTIAQRTDAAIKLASVDSRLAGTRAFYSWAGRSQEEIDQYFSEVRQSDAIAAINRIADAMPFLSSTGAANGAD